LLAGFWPVFAFRAKIRRCWGASQPQRGRGLENEGEGWKTRERVGTGTVMDIIEPPEKSPLYPKDLFSTQARAMAGMRIAPTKNGTMIL